MTEATIPYYESIDTDSHYDPAAQSADNGVYAHKHPAISRIILRHKGGPIPFGGLLEKGWRQNGGILQKQNL